MFSTEKSENRFRTILLTIALLLSAIVMVPNTASAEDEHLYVYADSYRGFLRAEIWIEDADYSSNYTAGWVVTDENDNIRDSGVLRYNGSDENPGEPGWWFELDIPDYAKGEYLFTVELYDDSGSMLDDFQETFWVQTWLDAEVPHHLEEAGNVTAVFTSGALDSNSTYRIDWKLNDRDGGIWTYGNISGSEGNMTFDLEEGSYDLQATLYRFEGDGNDTYWEHEDSVWREFYVGSENLEFYFNYYRGEVWVDARVEFPDENTTSYYVVWNITNSAGNEMDNGSEEMWEHEHHVDFGFNTAYPEGTYTFNIELYANQTNVVLDSQSRYFDVWPQLVISASTYYLEEAGNITFEFFVTGLNSTNEYMINWTLGDVDEYEELDHAQLNDLEGNITIYLDDGDYFIEAQLYVNHSYGNNGTIWEHLDSTSLYGIHVGGASLEYVWFNCCYHEYDDNDNYASWANFDVYVGWANYSSNYTLAWTIEDGNGIAILNGTADPEHEDEPWFYEHFELELPVGDYMVTFFLYENNLLVDTEMRDFAVYPNIYIMMETEWPDGSYVNANYFLNLASTTYTLNWTLRDQNGVEVGYGSFDSDDTEGMLEFFNLSAGDYYLEININPVNMYPFGQERWFWVENDPETNRDPYCDLSNGITIGSNLDADVGDDFTFSANCFDMDGDSMTLSAAVEHSSLAVPFFFADVTGNTSTWTYTLSEPGLYAFGISVEDSNGAKQAYAFAVTAHANDTTTDPNDNNTTDPNDNNTDPNATTEEEILEEIEAGEVPSVSMFASVVAIALIALRRRD